MAYGGGMDGSSLFGSAVPYYAAFRSGYPQADVDALAARVRLDRTRDVVDIGCGTGQLTIPLAHHARHVVAIDPVESMLAGGREAARAADLGNISWVQGNSSQLAILLAPGSALAVFAASFHWTDRSEVTETLDGLLSTDGSIVVINDDRSETEQPQWEGAIADVRARHLASGRAGNPVLEPSHADILRASPFSVVTRLLWSWSRSLTIDEVVGLQYSYSFSTPALLGDRAVSFGDDVRDAVLAVHPEGIVEEPFRVEVLIARRP